MTADTAAALLPAARRPHQDGRAAGGAADRWRGALRRSAPVLPAVAVVALVAVPAAPAGDGSAGTGSVADAASALLVAYCLVRLARERARPLTRTAALVLGLPVLGVTVAALTSGDPPAALPGVARYLQIFVLVPAALLLLIRDRRDFRLVAGAVVALALVEGSIGVTQYLTGTGASYMGENIRAVGTFGPTDVMGMATVVAYGLVICVGYALAPVRGPGPRRRTVALVCAGLLLVPLALSFSRGAWIATAVAVLLQLVISGPRRAATVVLAAGALGIVLVGGLGIGSQMISERLSSITRVTEAPDQSVADRYTMWAAATDMWRERPVTGVGLKGFPAHRDSHASLGLSAASDTAGAGLGFQRQPLLSPHNMYLLVLSEQGLLGIMALAGSWAALLVLALRRLPRHGRGGSGCAFVVAGLLVWQLVDFGYADIGGPSTVLMAVMFGLAAWWALSPDPGRPGPGRGRETGSGAAAA
ncbi:O-antigen ligase family protein [Streptomyces sp. GMY02]|uniref:O-antigen ligase family protein n=1 Tax=Streptomyces sp. GMY02 TaxID=1333528 RepID=UPI001C2C2A65|nr:O-antigen ligase family protein [Streptomyces sp. GMY02]QXE36425.1 O-antigen ligase family protein [Streptomyces sp. GMY02]